MNRITTFIKNSNKKRQTEVMMAKIASVRDTFYIDTTPCAIVVKHNSTVIKEFAASSTQKEILDTLEMFRSVAANNISN